MKRAAVHAIFWILLFISVSFLTAYLFTTTESKNVAMLARDLHTKVEKYGIPTFDIRDILYEEQNSTAILEFNLVNMGDAIVLNGWIIEFINANNGKIICRATIFTGDPTEDSRIYKEVTVPSRNVSLEHGDRLAPGDVASVSINLLQTCSNETINYARTGEKMIFRLTIPPSSASVILRCYLDPETGTNYICTE